jgi:hypothetical protein
MSGILLVALVAAAGGCDDDPAAPADPTAELRLLNGASDAAALDLLADGEVVITGVPYEGSSDYLEVPAGTQEVAVRATGTTTVLHALEANLVQGGSYSLMAGGEALSLAVRSPGDTGAVQVDRANIRVVNVAPPFTDSASAGPPILLDVHITAPGTDLTGRPAELSLDARFPSYSTLLYFEPGTWVVRFTEAGTATVVAGTEALSIGAGAVRAVMLEGTEGGGWTVAVVEE